MHPPTCFSFHFLFEQAFRCCHLASIRRPSFFPLTRTFSPTLLYPMAPAAVLRGIASTAALFFGHASAPPAPLSFAFLASASLASSSFLACTASSSSALRFLIFLSLRVSLSCDEDASWYSSVVLLPMIAIEDPRTVSVLPACRPFQLLCSCGCCCCLLL